MQAIQERFGIEGVDLAGAALHEKENHMLGRRPPVRRPGGQRVVGLRGTGTPALALARQEVEQGP
jgi:hypothetical protein